MLTIQKKFFGGMVEGKLARRVQHEVDIYNRLGRSLNVAHLYSAYEDEKKVRLSGSCAHWLGDGVWVRPVGCGQDSLGTLGSGPAGVPGHGVHSGRFTTRTPEGIIDLTILSSIP